MDDSRGGKIALRRAEASRNLRTLMQFQISIAFELPWSTLIPRFRIFSHCAFFIFIYKGILGAACGHFLTQPFIVVRNLVFASSLFLHRATAPIHSSESSFEDLIK
jgi:hypothetical protein